MNKIISILVLSLLLLVPAVLSVGPSDVCSYGWEPLAEGKVRCLPAPEVVAEQEAAKDNLLFFDVFNIGHMLYPKLPLVGLALFGILAYAFVQFLRFMNKMVRERTGGF